MARVNKQHEIKNEEVAEHAQALKAKDREHMRAIEEQQQRYNKAVDALNRDFENKIKPKKNN